MNSEAPKFTDILDRIRSAGSEHLRADTQAWLLGFIAARQKGHASTFEAFQALTAWTMAAIELADAQREQAGATHIADYATEAPNLVMEVPMWVATANVCGWMEALTTVDKESGRQTNHRKPLIEAFRLGKATGNRSIAEAHLIRQRDWRVAIEVAWLKAQHPELTNHAAHQAILKDRAQNATHRRPVMDLRAIERAWKEWGDIATRLLVGGTRPSTDSGG